MKNKRITLVKDTPSKLSIDIRNFGPICKGEINIKPLTIFVGPNDSGKSYIALLIHSLLNTNRKAIFLFKLMYSDFLSSLEKLSSYIIEDIKVDSTFEEISPAFYDGLKKGVKMLYKKGEFEFSKDFINNLLENICDLTYSDILAGEIKRTYACSLGCLNKIGKKFFSLEITSGSNKIKLKTLKNKIKIIERQHSDIIIKMKLKEDAKESFEIKKIDKHKFIIIVRKSKSKLTEKEVKDLSLMLSRVFIKLCVTELFGTNTIFSYYLPAARSGILQGHRLLAAEVVEKAPLVGIEDFEIQKFSGAVADFISSHLRLDTKNKGKFYTLAKELEKRLFEGKIEIRFKKKNIYPEIMYVLHGKDLPLYRTSSSVSELASLIIYLEYIIKPNSTLIIEEPESHLHPKNQLILAEFLVKLIRKNVNVIITTHSDYLLEQISNFIKLWKIGKQKRKKFGYDKNVYLKENEVSLFAFSHNEKKKGYEIKKINITAEDGIPQDDLANVIKDLYGETSSIQQELMR